MGDRRNAKQDARGDQVDTAESDRFAQGEGATAREAASVRDAEQLRVRHAGGTLALFDLDHTLIPFDSGMRWTRFLIDEGALGAEAESAYLDVCRAYVAGNSGIHDLHRFAVRALLPRPAHDLVALQQRFGQVLAAELPGAAGALVERHLQAGDTCCIVTTTNEWIARPFAQVFGVAHLLASVPCIEHGNFTGEFVGDLCHGTAKVGRVNAWLAEHGLDWSDFAHSVFYSDAISDLPLLETVAEAVAVDPDPALRQIARTRGWQIIEGIGKPRRKP